MEETKRDTNKPEFGRLFTLSIYVLFTLLILGYAGHHLYSVTFLIGNALVFGKQKIG